MRISTGALSATLDEAAAWADRAKAALDALPDGEWRQALALLADTVKQRELGQNIRALGRPDAAAAIVNEILKLIP